ncbi:MAG: DNA repair protein RadA [Patescibacteria group bacterium]|nr:DNA repair protein RadA [Patescibacteria group bacterium]
MPQNKTIYACSKCGSQFPKWLGQCSECGAWGTISETVQNNSPRKNFTTTKAGEVIEFSAIKSQNFSRFKTGIEELDRVLGGGLVPGSLILLGGAPGIGKSTLVLQIVHSLSNDSVLYVSGEESAEQVKLRLERIGVSENNLKFFGDTDVDVICATIEKHKPKIAVVDSIQTVSSSGVDSEAGSVNQIRASTAKLMEVGKKTQTTIFIVGHITKQGSVAGPKTLEHLVDVVLYLEGDSHHHFRFLRSYKNRFGSTNEVGVFEMKKQGLVEIKNPSEVFLANRNSQVISGSVIAAIMEGVRPFLIEVQALVSKTNFGYPQRKSTGFDFNRLQLLVAVLTKRCGLRLENQDIHINIVGGLEISEPAADLAVAMAIASAFYNKPIDAKTLFFGEVGLAGELRNVSWPEKRIKEAEKLGFEKIVMSKEKFLDFQPKIKIIQEENLSQAIKVVLG